MAKLDKDYFQIEEGMKQNEIKDILSDDEEVLVNLKPNRKVYLLESIFKGLPVVLIWLAADTFAITMIASTGTMYEPWLIAFFIFFFALHLIPVWIYIYSIIKVIVSYKNLEYVFTDKRIIVRSGLIGIDFKYVYYYEINSVTVNVGLFDRMFKVGDIIIKSNNQVVKVNDISYPYKYSNKIQEIVRDLKADMAFPNDLRPSENHGYNTKYKK